MKVWATIGSIILVLGALLLTSCEDYGYTNSAYTFSGPLDATAQAIALSAYATRQAVEVGVAEAAARGTLQAAQAQATIQAFEAQAAAQRAMATQWAVATASALQATRQAIDLAGTRQALALQATATERAYQATATAQYRADVATATAQAWAYQTTATAQAYQATATRVAEEREIVLGYGRDYGIPAVLLVLVIGLCVLIGYGVRQMARRPQVIPRDFRGDAQPLALPVKGGGWSFVDLDRQPGPVITLLPDGTADAPRLRSAGQEERTTARDQLADLTTRPRFGAGQKAGGAAPTLPLAPPPSPPAPGLRRIAVLRRLDQAATAGLIPPVLAASLEADWETEE